ncbi:MAG: hypothetical protein NUV75_07010 [Gallionella sp.]|nr:hypothetical protein [Gallionella sp.]
MAYLKKPGAVMFDRIEPAAWGAASYFHVPPSELSAKLAHYLESQRCSLPSFIERS